MRGDLIGKQEYIGNKIDLQTNVFHWSISGNEVTLFNYDSTRKTHIPSNLVVDHGTSDGESSSHRNILLLHDVWTTSNRLSGHKITSTISTA